MCAVPNMAVFCSSLISWFPGMLLRYCVSFFFEMAFVAHIITGIYTGIYYYYYYYYYYLHLFMSLKFVISV
jgi:hypothetical protein